MYKKILPMILLISASVFLFGCSTTLKDYKPKSAEEEPVKMTLVALQNAWNKGDQQGVLSLLHENGQFMIGRERKMVPKKKYADYLPTSMKNFPKAIYSDPTISVAGDKATIKVIGGTTGQFRFTYFMVRESNKWFITGWEY